MIVEYPNSSRFPNFMVENSSFGSANKMEFTSHRAEECKIYILKK